MLGHVSASYWLTLDLWLAKDNRFLNPMAVAQDLSQELESMGLLPGLRYHILFVIHLAVTKELESPRAKNRVSVGSASCHFLREEPTVWKRKQACEVN